MPITLGTLSPVLVPEDGGREMTIVDVAGLVAGIVNVFVIDGDLVAQPCYSGKSGEGFDIQVLEGQDTLKFVVPPLALSGGPHTVRVQQGVEVAELVSAFQTRNRNFSTKTMELRKVFAPFLLTGPRSIDVTSALAQDVLAIQTVPTLNPVLASPFSFLPVASNPRQLPLTWSSVGAPLPAGFNVNPSTGEITGTIGTTQLLTPADETAGITTDHQLEVTDGVDTAQSILFDLDAQGIDLAASLGVPDAYWPADVDMNDGIGSLNGTLLIGANHILSTEAIGAGLLDLPIGAKARVQFTSQAIMRPRETDGFILAMRAGFDTNTSVNIMSHRDVAGSRPGWWVGFDGAGNLFLSFSDGTNTATASYGPTGNLRPLRSYVMGWPSQSGLGSAVLFENGVLKANQSATPGALSAAGPTDPVFYMGDDVGDPSSPFGVEGRLDEIAWWFRPTGGLDSFDTATIAWLHYRKISLKEWIGF